MDYIVEIVNKDGLNVVSSRVIAKELGKRHGDVLESISKILTDGNLRSSILESEYVDKKGESRKEYLLTKEGFTLYMFNIQGYNDFKMAYINKFNEMEQKLNEKDTSDIGFDSLSEDEKRLFLRNETKKHNKSLSRTAHEMSNVNNYGKFHNAGYRGLYNGETAKDIKKRKQLGKNDDILDYMGSTELAANFFRITQTDERLKRGDVTTEEGACDEHFKIGRKVRNTMEEISGILPEDLPTPEKSVKEIEKEMNKIKEINKP